MEESQFDDVVRQSVTQTGRRRVLLGIGSLVVAALGAPRGEAIAAEQRKHPKGRHRASARITARVSSPTRKHRPAVRVGPVTRSKPLRPDPHPAVSVTETPSRVSRREHDDPSPQHQHHRQAAAGPLFRRAHQLPWAVRELTQNPNNCGACATQCSQPREECCGGQCVDTSADNRNCGTCGTTCSGGQSCVGGSCVCDATSCPTGCCAGTACHVDDDAACGSGGRGRANACTGGKTCQARTCRVSEWVPRRDAHLLAVAD